MNPKQRKAKRKAEGKTYKKRSGEKLKKARTGSSSRGRKMASLIRKYMAANSRLTYDEARAKAELAVG